jgi:G:T-mismatch repair DNA endonuclease (very short patch repair protein)
LKRNYSPIVDILLVDYKIAIECYGNNWHANPKFYKKNDLIVKFKGPVTAKSIWKFDNVRQKQIELFGYKVIVLWEDEINNNLDLCRKRIYEYCQNS